MKIDSLEQIEALVKLCRKAGVSSIEVDGVKLTISEQPKRARKAKAEQAQGDVDVNTLSEQDLLFWSASTPTEEASNGG